MYNVKSTHWARELLADQTEKRFEIPRMKKKILLLLSKESLVATHGTLSYIHKSKTEDDST